MTIRVKGKKNFEAKIREYRAKGFNIITYTSTFAELEKNNTLIVIER